MKVTPSPRPAALLTLLGAFALASCSVRGTASGGGGGDAFGITVSADIPGSGPCALYVCGPDADDVDSCTVPTTVEEASQTTLSVSRADWLLAACGDIWVGQEQSCFAASVEFLGLGEGDLAALSEFPATHCPSWGIGDDDDTAGGDDDDTTGSGGDPDADCATADTAAEACLASAGGEWNGAYCYGVSTKSLYPEPDWSCVTAYWETADCSAPGVGEDEEFYACWDLSNSWVGGSFACDSGVVDVWSVYVAAGDEVLFEADTRSAATASDLWLEVFPTDGMPTGSPVTSADDESACTFPPPEYRCPSTSSSDLTGWVGVVVGDYGSCAGETTEYELRVSRGGLPLSPTLDLNDLAYSP